MSVCVRTEFNQAINTTLVKLNYSTPRSDLSDTNIEDLRSILMMMHDDSKKLYEYLFDLMNALPVFGISKDTPLSEEMGNIIIEQVGKALNPLLYDLALIYVKIDDKRVPHC